MEERGERGVGRGLFVHCRQDGGRKLKAFVAHLMTKTTLTDPPITKSTKLPIENLQLPSPSILHCCNNSTANSAVNGCLHNAKSM